jgi:uncharacterized protein
LVLPAEYLAANPAFTLDIEIKARLISPHPYTNQDTLTLARGAVVYCVEDVDNPWVKDHFKSVQLDPACSVEEKHVTDQKTGDGYVQLSVKKGARLLDVENIHPSPGIEIDDIQRGGRVIDELVFVPYHFRANRGGSGQARVGLRQWRS